MGSHPEAASIVKQSKRQIRTEFEELADRALHLVLTPEEHRRFDEILDENPDLEEEFDGLWRTSRALRMAGLEEQDFTGLTTLPGSGRPGVVERILPRRRFLPIVAAAGILLALSVGIGIFYFRPGSFLPGQRMAGQRPVSRVERISGICYDSGGALERERVVPEFTAAGPGAVCNFRFEYEKKVSADLIGSARLQIDSHPASLVLRLHEGALLVDSKSKNREGKLTVEAGAIRLEALGTRFLVRQVTDDRGEKRGDDRIEIYLLEGKLRITPIAGTGSERGKIEMSGENGLPARKSAPILLQAGESWRGKGRNGRLVGTKRSLSNRQKEYLRKEPTDGRKAEALVEVLTGRVRAHDGETKVPILLQTIRTTDGLSYTGVIQQDNRGYIILTSRGRVRIPVSRVEKIRFRYQGEKE